MPESRASASVPDEILPAFSEVRLAPLPLKLPENVLPALPKELMPLKLFAPEKVWLPFSKGTFADKRASAKVPETSVPSATRLGVQSVPLNRRCWPAVGAVASTFTPRIRATVLLAVGPVASPPRFTALVEVTVIFVRPAPLPKKEPTSRLFTLVKETPPLKLFDPEKI